MRLAVLSALRDKNDLGLHSGLVDDGVMLLAELGVLNGRRKTIDLLDAMNRIGSTVFALGLGEMSNFAPNTAPARFGYLWGAPWFTCWSRWVLPTMSSSRR